MILTALNLYSLLDKLVVKVLIVSFFAALLASCTTPLASLSKPQTVTLRTSLGDIVIAVDQANAPSASNYFLDLISSGAYDGATFYRAGSLGDERNTGGPAQLIQGGVLGYVVSADGPVNVDRNKFPVLPEFETTEQTGKRHEYATVSFARDLLDTGVVIPELVICLRDVPQMDANGPNQPDSRGFPAFGTVVSGMETVSAIALKKTKPESYIKFLEGQVLVDSILIKGAYIN